MSPNENSLDPLPGKYADNLPPPLLHLSSILQLQFLPPATQPSMLCGFEGSSNVSDRLNEHPSLDSSSCLAPRHKSLKRPIEKSSFSTDHHYNETLLKQQLGLGLGLVSATPMVEKENEKARQKPESEQYHSKNLITERNRRNRIKDGLFTLRALVPKISKVRLNFKSKLYFSICPYLPYIFNVLLDGQGFNSWRCDPVYCGVAAGGEETPGWGQYGTRGLQYEGCWIEKKL